MVNWVALWEDFIQLYSLFYLYLRWSCKNLHWIFFKNIPWRLTDQYAKLLFWKVLWHLYLLNSFGMANLASILKKKTKKKTKLNLSKLISLCKCFLGLNWISCFISCWLSVFFFSISQTFSFRFLQFLVRKFPVLGLQFTSEMGQ